MNANVPSLPLELWEHIASYGGSLALYRLLLRDLDTARVAAMRIACAWRARQRTMQRRLVPGTMFAVWRRASMKLALGTLIWHEQTSSMLCIQVVLPRRRVTHILFPGLYGDNEFIVRKV